ncbi:MAG: hypothetical protein N4J56_006924 [Chroococcidiopsis sp. SAG 2025]|nr:hypothetical protein [Chroococcidiopsis sp. SAG 2025]
MPRASIIFKGILVAQGKGVVEPDTVADNFGGESMARIYEAEIVNLVEPVRLFYFWVKLTMPLEECTT